MASFFNEDLHSSDSDDDDYVPDAGEATSDEDPLPSDDEIKTKEQSKKNGKVLDDAVEEMNEPISEWLVTGKKNVDEKQKADNLFKSFLEEVEADMKVKENEGSPGGEKMSTPENNSPDSGIKSIASSSKTTPDMPIEIFDFAGETVAVSGKDITEIASAESSNAAANSGENLERSDPSNPESKLPAKRKGLQSVLGTIMNKGKKLSVLDKTSLDWMKFKKEHNLSEELQTFNKGRGGFIERQRFLERSDVRSYEIERDMRMSKRKKNC